MKDGFVKVACATPRLRVADVTYNVGEINALIRTLAQADIEDMTIAEPDLEEIVLHFYEEGGE